MHRQFLPGLTFLALLGALQAQLAGLQPPVAKKVAKVTEIHGDKLVDNYYWLRQKKDPEVLKHLGAENAYTEAIMKPTLPLQDKLYKEFLSRIQQTDLSVPVKIGNFLYYTRTEEGMQYPIHCRKPGNLDAKEQILLDLNELAKGHKFYDINVHVASDDGNLLAYTSDTTGFREYTLQIKDLRTGKVLVDKLTKVDTVVWASDNQTLFYVTEDDAKRFYRLWRHKLGEPAEKDVLLHDEKDELFELEVTRSRDRKYVFLHIFSYASTEVRYLKLDQPGEPLRVVLPREQDHRYDVEHRGGQFYIRTNKEAKNFRLVTAPAASPGPKSWQELIGHRPEVLLDAVHTFADHLVAAPNNRGGQHLCCKRAGGIGGMLRMLFQSLRIPMCQG